jgi:hypothetical protein
MRYGQHLERLASQHASRTQGALVLVAWIFIIALASQRATGGTRWGGSLSNCNLSGDVTLSQPEITHASLVTLATHVMASSVRCKCRHHKVQQPAQTVQ